ncbi:hypothetical protein BKA63DRAFT_587641 [Paraphoma chrysanthemicola]|nr:hypothetical protein BKA63DRAFT_587641 [Paraphoma chrysanthemicola]
MIYTCKGDPRFLDPALSLLREAILSLAVTFFGSQHNQKKIITRGYAHYGAALRQINTHLAQPELQTTNESLLIALSCMLLEIFLPTRPTSFLNHQRGIEAIMKMRGPPSQSLSTTATVFRDLRVLCCQSRTLLPNQDHRFTQARIGNKIPLEVISRRKCYIINSLPF